MEIEGAGGVVFNRSGHVLLISHRDGHWVFPKGHLDHGETPLEAALREVEEEAGVTAACADPGLSFETSYVNSKGEHRRITWFVLTTDATEPVLREEAHPDGFFVNPAEAFLLLEFEEDRELLRQALDAMTLTGSNR